jgi:DNA-binding PadR family transcriptional regulator
MLPAVGETLREPTYYLLAALLDGPLHGYAIAKVAADLSDGRVRLTAGTLYGALERLVERGWLRKAGDEVTAGGRRRRAYALTDEGRKTLLDEARRMRQAAAIVDRRSVSAALEAAGT